MNNRIKMNLNKDVRESKKLVVTSPKEIKALKKWASKKARANAKQAIKTGNYDKVFNFVGVTGRDIS